MSVVPPQREPSTLRAARSFRLYIDQSLRAWPGLGQGGMATVYLARDAVSGATGREGDEGRYRAGSDERARPEVRYW